MADLEDILHESAVAQQWKLLFKVDLGRPQLISKRFRQQMTDMV